MISDEVRKYCRKIYHHLIENYAEAVNSEEMYICHHRKEITEDGKNAFTADELIDLGEYYHRPPEELIFLTKSAHKALHMVANNKDNGVTVEHKREMAKLRNRKWREKHREEVNQKSRERYANDKEFRERKAANHKKWIENHPDWNKEAIKRCRERKKS